MHSNRINRTKNSFLKRQTKGPVEGLFCNYSHRVCMQNRLDGSLYCLKHILEDKNTPFKQCSYVATKTGKRCPNAAPKAERKDEEPKKRESVIKRYCFFHARRAALLRQRSTRKCKPKETPETLLEELDHYGSPECESDVRKYRNNNESLASRIIDYASSSDSDIEPPLVDQAWRGEGESDAESIDSEQDDPLKHAAIYTAEEVALILRDKLIRLQSLYIDQFKRLQHIMKERRRKYLHTYKQERETLGPIQSYKSSPEQKDKYAKLVAMKRHHRRFCKETLLYEQSKRRRIAVTEGTNYRPPGYPKCIHSESNVKCNSRAMPLSKFCNQHILYDPDQVLYQPCPFANGACSKPVSVIADNCYCQEHIQIKDMPPRVPLVKLENLTSDQTRSKFETSSVGVTKKGSENTSKPPPSQSASFDSNLGSKVVSAAEGNKQQHVVLQAKGTAPMLLTSSMTPLKRLQLSQQHKLRLKSQQQSLAPVQGSQTSAPPLHMLHHPLQIQSKMLPSSSLDQPTKMLQNRWMEQVKLSQNPQRLQSVAGKLTSQSAVSRLSIIQNSRKPVTLPQQIMSVVKGPVTAGSSTPKSRPGPSSPLTTQQSVDRTN
ncbi:KAT8 regulatory NSL complex subunit 2-like [Argonauta hians]